MPTYPGNVNAKGIDPLQVRYDTVWRTHRVGDLEFRLLQLRDFEEAVDRLIAALEAEGKDDIVPEDCPYFGQIWSSAESLAETVLTLPVAGKRVLEIGCGLALPSLVAARLGAAACMTLDIHPDVATFLSENLRANGLEGKVDHHPADWRKYRSEGCYDYVLGSDVLYEPQHPGEIIAFLETCLAPGGEAIIVDPSRWHYQEFAREVRARGFAIAETLSEKIVEGRPVRLRTMRIARD